MKPLKITLAVLIIVCIGSVIYAQQAKNEAVNYQMQVVELQTTLEQQEIEAYALKEKAQMAAVDARVAMNTAKEQARNAEVKIRELEKSLKNCKVGR